MFSIFNSQYQCIWYHWVKYCGWISNCWIATRLNTSLIIKTKKKIIIPISAANKLLLELRRFLGLCKFSCFHTAFWVNNSFAGLFKVSDQMWLARVNQYNWETFLNFLYVPNDNIVLLFLFLLLVVVSLLF